MRHNKKGVNLTKKNTTLYPHTTCFKGFKLTQYWDTKSSKQYCGFFQAYTKFNLFIQTEESFPADQKQPRLKTTSATSNHKQLSLIITPYTIFEIKGF